MKLTASVKRIVWAIGWYTIWIINDYLIYLREGQEGGPIYQVLMLFILVIPLIFFKDDKEKRK